MTSADSFNTVVAAWARAFFSRPSRVAVLVWVTTTVALMSILPIRHLSRPSTLALVVPAVTALAYSGLRITIGRRLPGWCLQVDVGLGNVLVTAVAAVGAGDHANLANLYLLYEVFAFLYFPLRTAVGHLGAAGAAYAVVLAFGTASAGGAFVAWLAVFGTAVVLGAVVLGLVSVLRVTAREDPLTGLANRRMWDERLDEELERARRFGSALSVVMLDLDGFKAVNDLQGHDAGDRLLRSLAGSWRNVVRGGGDFLARLGGDEFAVLAPGSDAFGADVLAERLENALPAGVSVSTGLATWDGSEKPAELLRRADLAMYEAKRGQRGTDRRVLPAGLERAASSPGPRPLAAVSREAGLHGH